MLLRWLLRLVWRRLLLPSPVGQTARASFSFPYRRSHAAPPRTPLRRWRRQPLRVRGAVLLPPLLRLLLAVLLRWLLWRSRLLPSPVR